MSNAWKEHAYRAIVDLAAANIAENDREILSHLDRAKDNIDWPMAAVREAKSK